MAWISMLATVAAVLLWWPRRRPLTKVAGLGAGRRQLGERGQLQAHHHLTSGLLTRGLPNSGSRLAPARRMVVALGCGLLAALLVPGVVSVLAMLVAAVIGWVLAPWIPDGAGRRRRTRIDQELPTTVELLAAVLASGAPLRQAVAEVAAVSPPTTREVLESVVAHLQVGLSEEFAWRQLADRVDWSAGWSTVARDLAAASVSGSAVVSVLELHAREGRRRQQESWERRARTVGVRSVLPLMVCFLPAFVLVAVVPIIAGLLLSYW